jgi:predicted nucleotidyltransferase
MPRTRKPIDVSAEIERLVKRIVKKFHPEQIILFGSQARGDARPDSDIDLLVVMNFRGRKLDTMVELQGIVPSLHRHVDILVTTPEHFAWRKNVVGTIEWPACREGKVLYART